MAATATAFTTPDRVGALNNNNNLDRTCTVLHFLSPVVVSSIWIRSILIRQQAPVLNTPNILVFIVLIYSGYLASNNAAFILILMNLHVHWLL